MYFGIPGKFDSKGVYFFVYLWLIINAKCHVRVVTQVCIAVLLPPFHNVYSKLLVKQSSNIVSYSYILSIRNVIRNFMYSHNLRVRNPTMCSLRGER
jgi:hypothetical protein